LDSASGGAPRFSSSQPISALRTSISRCERIQSASVLSPLPRSSSRMPATEIVPSWSRRRAKPRPVDRKRMQPQVGVQQRAPGNDRVDDREHDRLVAGRIVDAHVGDDEPRQEAAPVGLDRADADLEAGALRHLGDDVLAIFLDARQHPVAQREKAERKHEERDPARTSMTSSQREMKRPIHRNGAPRRASRPGGLGAIVSSSSCSDCIALRAASIVGLTFLNEWFTAPLRLRFYK
jgi:hypothetical protein